jgi:hypothetical protein
MGHEGAGVELYRARKGGDGLDASWLHKLNRRTKLVHGLETLKRLNQQAVALHESKERKPGTQDISPEVIRAKMSTNLTKDDVVQRFNQSGSKYLREMRCLVDGRADVYAILEAFAVTCPARQHAIKKLLCSGIRGKGDAMQDLKEARDAVDRAIQMASSR